MLFVYVPGQNSAVVSQMVILSDIVFENHATPETVPHTLNRALLL